MGRGRGAWQAAGAKCHRAKCWSLHSALEEHARCELQIPGSVKCIAITMLVTWLVCPGALYLLLPPRWMESLRPTLYLLVPGRGQPTTGSSSGYEQTRSKAAKEDLGSLPYRLGSLDQQVFPESQTRQEERWQGILTL